MQGFRFSSGDKSFKFPCTLFFSCHMYSLGCSVKWQLEVATKVPRTFVSFAFEFLALTILNVLYFYFSYCPFAVCLPASKVTNQDRQGGNNCALSGRSPGAPEICSVILEGFFWYQESPFWMNCLHLKKLVRCASSGQRVSVETDGDRNWANFW